MNNIEIAEALNKDINAHTVALASLLAGNDERNAEFWTIVNHLELRIETSTDLLANLDK